MKRLLVGIDDSPGAFSALRWADDLVARYRAAGEEIEGTVVTVRPSLAFDLGPYLTDGTLEREALDLLARAASALSNPEAFDHVARTGAAATVILEEAAARKVDLIVVGSRGRGGVAQVLLGSVSRHVAAVADRPVAIVPHPANDTGETVVVAYDGSPNSRAALRWALDNTESELTVVSAWSLPTTLVLDPADPAACQLEAATHQMLSDGIEKVCGGTIDDRITPMVRHGDPRIVLLDPSLNPSLIVMGSHGHSGVRRLLLGSTSNYVAGASTVPVILVPRPEDG